MHPGVLACTLPGTCESSGLEPWVREDILGDTLNFSYRVCKIEKYIYYFEIKTELSGPDAIYLIYFICKL
jgi:hypothetical protein